MEVIDFRGTRQVIDEGDDIKEIYLGSELMWKIKTKLTGVFSRDEVDLEGLKSNDCYRSKSLAFFDGYILIAISHTEAKYIEINDQFIEVQDGEVVSYERNVSFQTTRFNKAQAEQLLGITIDDPDQMGMEIPDSVDIKYWY